MHYFYILQKKNNMLLSIITNFSLYHTLYLIRNRRRFVDFAAFTLFIPMDDVNRFIAQFYGFWYQKPEIESIELFSFPDN